MDEKDLEAKKDEIKIKLNKIFKDIYFFGFLVILFFGIILRLYFLYVTKDQAHWWDTLAYGSLAKQMVYGLWTNISFLAHEHIIRPPLLPLIWSLLLRVGVSELVVNFLTQIIPSVLSIWIIYLLASRLYDKKVALISAFILAVSWIHLFYSVRIMTEAPSLFFILVSLYFFSNSFENLALRDFSLSILFLSLAILMRYQSGVIGFVYLVV